MKKPGPSSLEARLSRKKRRVTGLHDVRLSWYVKVIDYLLGTYATDDIIAGATKELESCKLGPVVLTPQDAKQLYT